MIFPITSDPAIAGGAHMADYRHRTTPGARPLLHNSTPMAHKNAGAGNDSQFERPDDRKTAAQPQPTRPDSASMFAAAVIAGALPPTPQTMEELIQRIGISPIPEESQARLKDLLA